MKKFQIESSGPIFSTSVRAAIPAFGTIIDSFGEYDLRKLSMDQLVEAIGAACFACIISQGITMISVIDEPGSVEYDEDGNEVRVVHLDE